MHIFHTDKLGQFKPLFRHQIQHLYNQLSIPQPEDSIDYHYSIMRDTGTSPIPRYIRNKYGFIDLQTNFLQHNLFCIKNVNPCQYFKHLRPSWSNSRAWAHATILGIRYRTQNLTYFFKFQLRSKL